MRQRGLDPSRMVPRRHPLYGKKTYIPRMAESCARALAAVMRSLGVDAEVVPPSDGRTLELGGKYSSGDECYPLKVTLGDFLQILEQPGLDPKKTAFFMATGQGPCRFGQYAPYLKHVLAQLGHRDVTIFHPSCEKGYSDFGEASNLFVRGAWRAIVAGDIVRKLQLKTRPHEVISGSADQAYEESVVELCRVLEVPYPNDASQMSALQECLRRVRQRFREVAVQFHARKPLIGVVGEIFCRLHEFSNNDLVRRLEDAGAEVWVNDMAEWIWYVNVDELYEFKLHGEQISLQALRARIRNHIQRKDEHALTLMFHDDFRGYEEPEDVQEILDYAEPYLPASGASGEMVVNVGKAVYFARKGLDGVIDISPFTCMNGIVGEAVYPRVSRDNAGIPIRNFYFDGTQSDLDRDIGIFLELAKSYQRRKPWPRQMPAIAETASTQAATQDA
jgi:predicted nucleotide-binding protein (sugar kinase/HSP70/actin superfamily)